MLAPPMNFNPVTMATHSMLRTSQSCSLFVGIGYVTALFAVTGCQLESLKPDPPGLICTAEARAAVNLRIQDSASGAGIAAGTTVVLRDGAFVDSLSIPADRTDLNDQPLSTMNTYERAGRYDITVRRNGYATWTRSGVVVTAGECHVNAVTVVARLQPAS